MELQDPKSTDAIPYVWYHVVWVGANLGNQDTPLGEQDRHLWRFCTGCTGYSASAWKVTETAYEIGKGPAENNCSLTSYARLLIRSSWPENTNFKVCHARTDLFGCVCMIGILCLLLEMCLCSTQEDESTARTLSQKISWSRLDDYDVTINYHDWGTEMASHPPRYHIWSSKLDRGSSDGPIVETLSQCLTLR